MSWGVDGGNKEDERESYGRLTLARDSSLGKQPGLGTQTLCKVCEMSNHALGMGAKGMTTKALGFGASPARGIPTALTGIRKTDVRDHQTP